MAKGNADAYKIALQALREIRDQSHAKTCTTPNVPLDECPCVPSPALIATNALKEIALNARGKK